MTKNEEGKKLLREFERTIALAKARAYSKLSLERPLTPTEFAEFQKAFNKGNGETEQP